MGHRAVSSVLAALVLAAGCGDSAESPLTESLEPPTEAPVLTLDSDPGPIFDFRRGVLYPRDLAGSTRSCAALSVSEASLAADDPRPVTTAAVRRVRCRNRAQGYVVLVLFEEAIAEQELTLPPRELGADLRLDLRLAGLSADGRTPITVFEGTRHAAAEPPLSASPRAEPRGFDFARVAEDVSLIGTRRSCAIRAASTITRVLRDDLEQAPTDETEGEGDTDGDGDTDDDGEPDDEPDQDDVLGEADAIVAVMPVTCVHEGGRSSITLRFDSDALADVLLVEPRATVHGTVESARTLRVAHVTAAAL